MRRCCRPGLLTASSLISDAASLHVTQRAAAGSTSTPTSSTSSASPVTPPLTAVTHEVFNQASILEGFNAMSSNRRLQECIRSYFGHNGTTASTAAATENSSEAVREVNSILDHYGGIVGNAAFMEHARLANEFPPQFTPFDRQGRRIDSITFHPSYHALLSVAMTHGVHCGSYRAAGRHAPPSQVSRCALSYLHYQLEQSTGCPLTMTYACVPVLQRGNEGGVFSEWIDKLTVPEYDSRDLHISLKRSAMCGMSMTEKQGGSDVRSNTTTARPFGINDGTEPTAAGSPYILRGHKWFTSAPMCDAFLTLAKTSTGLSCFLVPRWTAPGQRNTGLRFQRLKNKLGDRGNASSEVEYHDAIGYLVGPLGHGVRTIIEMVNLTRQDCLLGSAALTQVATFHAVHHASGRKAFGKLLRDQPLMQAVLCDLALESEASTALAMRMAWAFERPELESFRRISVAVAKYYVCKRAPSLVFEALECMGGNGYVEDLPLARMFRQSPLNAIWEGSGNVIVLDVFRALAKEPECFVALQKEIVATGNKTLTAAFEQLAKDVKGGTVAEAQGRYMVEFLAKLLQAAALYHCDAAASSGGGEGNSAFEDFVKSRFASSTPRQFSYLVGNLPSASVNPKLIERHVPVLTTTQDPLSVPLRWTSSA